ncbi:hypothetical protein [Pseudomonas haemolytica]|uniref:hypothetical protein n=1 Tax=Pseudomonas haemolytica TaxID=2600065 RepID=UPI001396B15C|nr:hypothetical protein [Pseudomonas haemolytica]
MTYSNDRILFSADHLLIKPLETFINVASSGKRTPYPQMHQQTLGATLPMLWKTTPNLHKSGDPAF